MTNRHETEGLGKADPTSWNLIRRLLGLAWEYRRGCIKVLMLQIVLLAMGLSGLGLMGVGVDYIRYMTAMRTAAVAAAGGQVAVIPAVAAGTVRPPPAAPSRSTAVKPPRWPFGFSPPASWGPMAVIGAISGAILAFALLRAFLNMIYTVEVSRLVQGQIVVNLRTRVYDTMQRLSFRFFDANASGSLINRVTGDVQNVRSFVDGVVVQSLILVLSLAVYLVYMTSIHVRLTLACLATTPLLWYMTARFSRAVKPAYLANRELFDRQVLALSESIQGIHVVKGFAREEQEIAKFREAAAAVRDQKRWIFRKVSRFQPLINLLTNINLVVMLGYGGYLAVCYERAPDTASAVLAGVSIGQLLVFTGLLQQFSGQVANIASIANTMQQSLTGAQRVFEVLDARVEIQSPPGAVRLPQVRGEVVFEDVSFAYDPNEPVLSRIAFSAKPGQLVAIVGMTGSGKSTLVSLIPRFYDPQQGRVLVDGYDVRALDLDDLRRGIGIVFQESFLFSNSVAANIAFGHPEAARKQIEWAARIASAHDFITELPNGYDTVLREGGSDLSGGQRQRLAIARALLLEPSILLLDDPTAAVDARTEDEILEAMEGAAAGRTTFVVAHRLSTLQRADQVIVLDRGNIVQRGTHEELMSARGHYRRAARLQLPDEESLQLLSDAFSQDA